MKEDYKSHETRGDIASIKKPYEKLNELARGLKSLPLINMP